MQTISPETIPALLNLKTTQAERQQFLNGLLQASLLCEARAGDAASLDSMAIMNYRAACIHAFETIEPMEARAA